MVVDSGAAEAAVRELRGIAHGWVDGWRVEPGALVEVALRALSAGVYTPSLLELAALMSGEEREAPELFDRVMEELGFGFRPPADYWAGRLALARWWAAEIAGGWLDPYDGAESIIENVAEAYGACHELAPMVDAVRAPAPDDAPEHLLRAARELLARIPVPTSTP